MRETKPIAPGFRGLSLRRGAFWLRIVLRKLRGGGLALLLVPGLLVLPILQSSAQAATISDNFNRANGGLGANWTTVSGTTAPQIVNNTVQPGTAGTLNSAYWSANTFGANQYAAASFPNSSGTNWGPAIAVRLSNSKGYILWYGNQTNVVSIWRMDSSTSWTQLKASAQLTIAATDVWRFQAVGSTLTGYQNGKQVITVTDTRYTTGAPGIWMYFATNQITNWSGGDVTTIPTYSVGGTASGLSGTVVLQDNGGDNLSVAANGSFTFPTKLTSGSAYAVTVLTQPTGQTCAVSGGTGTVGSANVASVAVTCTTSGGSGTLTATDDFNRANGALGSNWTAMADGAMTISSQVAIGTSGQSGDTRTAETYTSDQYSQIQLTSAQPSGGQWIGTAVRSKNSGLDLYVGLYFANYGSPLLMLFKRSEGNFAQLGASYSTSALPAGTTLKLTAAGSSISFLLNGAAVITVTDTSLTGGAPAIMAYGPTQLDNWTGGNIGGGGGPSYTVGGTLSGMSGTVVLNDNGGDALTLSANGAFAFATPVPSGSQYNVTIASVSVGQTCAVTNGSGTVGSGNVTTVAVTCTASSGGSGLSMQYVSTDSTGIQTYQATSPDNGPGPQTVRILQPSNPAPGVAHNFLYVLPVEAGTNTIFGDGLQVIQSANLQNQYNLTVIEPSFSIQPWYADNPLDSNLQEDTFMATDLQPWVKANLSTSGTEQHWLIGFSKSGIGGQTLILRHPDKFTLAASWDFPADMSAYDQYSPSSQASYGTDANFQANYRLSAAFVAAHAAPFQANNRIWVGGYGNYPQDISDYDALLTANGIKHTTGTPAQRVHNWYSGWVPGAMAALYADSVNLH